MKFSPAFSFCIFCLFGSHSLASQLLFSLYGRMEMDTCAALLMTENTQSAAIPATMNEGGAEATSMVARKTPDSCVSIRVHFAAWVKTTQHMQGQPGEKMRKSERTTIQAQARTQRTMKTGTPSLKNMCASISMKLDRPYTDAHKKKANEERKERREHSYAFEKP